MGLEAATYIHQLNPSNPVGAVDPKAQGDDHLRMIKSTLQATFPTINGPVTVTLANLNLWAGLGGAYAWTGQQSWTQQIRAAAGATATPSLSFDGDRDTGFYSQSANVMDLAVGGSLTVRFNPGHALGDDGTLANPMWSFFNDPDTGIYRGGVNTIGFSAGGTQTLVSTATQTYLNAGVFNVPDGGAGAPSLGFSNDPDTGFYRWGADAFAATSGGNAVMSWRLGQSRINDGTVGAPALTFENDTDCGFYRTGANVISIAVNGAQVGQWSVGVGGAFQAPNGSVTNPGMSFLADNNTGWWMNAAADMRASVSGVLVAQVVSGVTGALKIMDYGNSLQTVGFRNIPQNIQNANYTAVLADSAKHVLHGNGAGAGHTHTIPANAAVPYDIGTTITFINRDANVVSIAITTDTLILANSVLTGTRTLAQNGIATAIKVAATTWVISGPGVS